jgi:uncharacterized membrane protein YkvA (DUF1232 family)
MRITFELQSSDLQRFSEAFDRARRLAADLDEIEILDAAKHALDNLCIASVPSYVRNRLVHVQRVILMLEDDDWSLPGPDRIDALAALAYFSDPEDLIPDHLEVIGLFDDAVMLELLARRMRKVLEAWKTFCEFRAGLTEDQFAEHEARSRNARALAAERARLIDLLQIRRNRLASRKASQLALGES